MALEQLGQHGQDIIALELALDMDRQALAAVLVDHGKHAEGLIPFAWGILSQHIFIGIGLAAGAWLALRKAKARGAGSALVHAAYWYLPGSFLGLKATPPSHCRLLAG